MLRLTAYLDESGHSKNPETRFVGMAGFVAPLEKWEAFVVSWRKTLDAFSLKDAFHMKDFAHSTGQFAVGWKAEKQKREDLFGKLIDTIKATGGTPVGAIVSLEGYESLTECQRSAFKGPYYIAFQICTRGAAIAAHFLPIEERVDMVYAYNEEFGAIKPAEMYSVDHAGNAEQLWHAIKDHTDFGQRMGKYASGTPAELVQVQAADVVAYELAKEFENRINRPNDEMRYGLRQILRMVPIFPKFQLLDRLELLRIVKENRFACQVGVDELEDNQMLSAMQAMLKWFVERGQFTEVKMDDSQF